MRIMRSGVETAFTMREEGWGSANRDPCRAPEPLNVWLTAMFFVFFYFVFFCCTEGGKEGLVVAGDPIHDLL